MRRNLLLALRRDRQRRRIVFDPALRAAGSARTCAAPTACAPPTARDCPCRYSSRHERADGRRDRGRAGVELGASACPDARRRRRGTARGRCRRRATVCGGGVAIEPRGTRGTSRAASLMRPVCARPGATLAHPVVERRERRAPTSPSSARRFFDAPACAAAVGRRHDAERDVGRLIVARVGVRDVVRQRADRRRPRRRARLLAARPAPPRCGRRSGPTPPTRRSPRRRRSDRRRTDRRASCVCHVSRSTRRPVDVGVAVHHAEADELRLLEARNQPQHARLLAPLQLRLKADEAEVIAGEVVLPQLHDGVRRRARCADRPGRPASSDRSAACRGRDAPSPRSAGSPSKNFSLSKSWTVADSAVDQRVVEPLVLVLRHRAVQIVAFARRRRRTRRSGRLSPRLTALRRPCHRGPTLEDSDPSATRGTPSSCRSSRPGRSG